MPTKQPSFSDRIAELKRAVKCLDEVANVIDAEVEHMQAAAKRFSERRGPQAKRRTR
jgi:hypothetical protein